MSPGSVGLYQINFRIPEVPSGTPRCSRPGTVGPGGYVITSNLTISIQAGTSFDSIGICVEVDGGLTGSP